jgi:nicotinate dehydrogenase subunit B
MTVTADTRSALDGARVTRRSVLKGSGALVVAFAMGPVLAPRSAVAQGGAGSSALDAWLAVGKDGLITAYTGKCELGQGLYTAQTQLIAEELCVSLDRVSLVQCDTARTPDQGTTSGSQSHPTNFNDSNLALAAATARERLVELAAARLGVPAAELVAQDGDVVVRADRSRRVAYGDLIGGERFNLTLDRAARRKPASEWTILGTSVKRLDVPALVSGELEFIHNVRVPGMLHGRVIRPPVVGAKLVAVDERSVQDLPGDVRVVVKNDFVGVVAARQWQAIQAAAAVELTWSSGSGLPRQADYYTHLRNQPARDTLLVDSGDVDNKLAVAGDVVRAAYRHPFQMHGSIGAACAVADVRDEGVTIWSATQAVYPLRSTTAMLLGRDADDVRVIFVRGPGCYGVNGADTASFDAALLSQATGKPVRVLLTRKDEMAWENYGYAFVLEQRAALDAARNIVAWDHESWSTSRGGRPGYDTPGNVVTGMLAGFEVPELAPRSPAPAPTAAFDNGQNAALSYVTGCVGGACGGTGTVKSERVLMHVVASPFWTGPLRSPWRLQNTFSHESFIDEIAARVRADPVEYRLRHIADPRLRDVVSAAARTANWSARPSPRPSVPRTALATGRGMACCLYEGDNGYAAMVAEVEVDQESGSIKVTRLVIAADSGPISNPDGVKNQIEGGALQGLSRALGEEVTWDAEKVTSVDWSTYHSLDLSFEVPQIESVLINRPDVVAMGAGETAITIVAAAVANAIFDATGTRLREIPFTPARVKAALDLRPA